MVHYFDRSQFTMVDYGRGGKQKVVMKVSMKNRQIRIKALKTVAFIDGLISVMIDGEKLVCIGDGFDVVCLVRVLRKKIGYADLISIGPGIRDEEHSDAEGSDSSPTGSLQPICCFPV